MYPNNALSAWQLAVWPGPDGPGACRLPGLTGRADLDGQLVVPEAQIPADQGGVALRIRVGPHRVGELAIAQVDRPVRGRALVGAHGVRVAGLEQFLPDVCGRDVEPV